MKIILVVLLAVAVAAEQKREAEPHYGYAGYYGFPYYSYGYNYGVPAHAHVGKREAEPHYGHYAGYGYRRGHLYAPHAHSYVYTHGIGKREAEADPDPHYRGYGYPYRYLYVPHAHSYVYTHGISKREAEADPEPHMEFMVMAFIALIALASMDLIVTDTRARDFRSQNEKVPTKSTLNKFIHREISGSPISNTIALKIMITCIFEYASVRYED
ncbi:uncharacterized protein LOC119571193 [Penaeus monodon]|uniref:uncharacterized protein LOC119571193 n=1 Tax=Penaeus monodon TaxID=6687 RepID=UPI0018A76CD6|nr:uncharacterized protein LOC119571193 [Penaeus monodon]